MTRFSDSIFARLLRRLAGAVCRHPVSFVWPQILLFCLSVFYAAYELKLDMRLVEPADAPRLDAKTRRASPRTSPGGCFLSTTAFVPLLRPESLPAEQSGR